MSHRDWIMGILHENHSGSIIGSFDSFYSSLLYMGKTELQKVIKKLKPYLEPTLGLYYGSLHIIIMLTCSTVLLFDNNKLVSHRFNLYCYDVSGNKIDFNQYTDCTNGFYENCYILKDDLI